MLHSIAPTLRAGTLDLPAMPHFLQAWIVTFLSPILAWAEERILRQMLLRCADHPLVQLGLHYDPAPVVAACAHYHHQDGPGKLPT